MTKSSSTDNTPTLERLFYCLRGELLGAEDKFPGNADNLAALQEKVGELANALLEHKYGNAENEAVFAEAVQVAAMALKIARNGDESFPYKYTYECYQRFKPTRGAKDQDESAPGDPQTGDKIGRLPAGVYAVAPECKVSDYVSHGKFYRVIAEDNMGAFAFRLDSGEISLGRWRRCPHLQGDSWLRATVWENGGFVFHNLGNST